MSVFFPDHLPHSSRSVSQDSQVIPGQCWWLLASNIMIVTLLSSRGQHSVVFRQLVFLLKLQCLFTPQHRPIWSDSLMTFPENNSGARNTDMTFEKLLHSIAYNDMCIYNISWSWRGGLLFSTHAWTQMCCACLGFWLVRYLKPYQHFSWCPHKVSLYARQAVP